MTEVTQGTGRHGRLYWCIRTDLSASGEIHVAADRVEVTACGALIAWGSDQIHRGSVAAEASVNLVCAPGRWSAAYVASPVDGGGVAIQNWPGEAARAGASASEAMGNATSLHEVPRQPR
jgi:hypothetical protein